MKSPENLQAEIARLRHSLAGANQIISELHVDLVEARQQIERANGKANAVLAAQGLLPHDVPQGMRMNGSVESPGQVYARLRKTDPAAAGKYYFENAEAILRYKSEFPYE
jgi:hypothetical protein